MVLGVIAIMAFMVAASATPTADVTLSDSKGRPCFTWVFGSLTAIGGSTANSTSTRTGNGVMLNATNAKLGNIAGNCGVNVTTVSFELSQFDTAATDESGGGDEFGPVKGGLSSIGTSNCTNSIAVAATFGLDGTDAVHATHYNLAALSFKLSQRCCDRCPHPQNGGLVIYSGVANVSDSTDATKGLNMAAKINTSLQCNTSAFNYTLAASKENAHPLKSVTITDVAVQAFLPVIEDPGASTFSASDRSAICPTTALDTTTGIIIGAVIAGVSALFLIVFALGNCGANKSQYTYRKV